MIQEGTKKVFFTFKAYLNGKDLAQTAVLTHDVKRALLESGAKSGHINIVSTSSSVGVSLMDSKSGASEALLRSLVEQFSKQDQDDEITSDDVDPLVCQGLAALVGLSLTVPFEAGRMSCHPNHDIFAFDFEPKAGRREFVITIIGDS